MPIDETEDGYRGSSTVSRQGKQPKQVNKLTKKIIEGN